MKILTVNKNIIMIKNNKIIRHKETIERMMKIYCKKHNKGEGLCDVCSTILDYVHYKIDNCRFGTGKPLCSKCSVYCYNSEMKKSIKHVMKYSAPRMLVKHPILTIIHLAEVMTYKSTL